MEANSLPRKSCDLCYNRKIKCDGQKPRCSNCVAYDIACKHTAPSRRSKPKSQRNGHATDTEEILRLKAEIHRLKAQLEQHREPDLSSNPRHDITAARIEDGTADDDANNTTATMRLPPLEQAMSLLGIFLKNFNSVLPLFEADTLLRLFGECYALLPQQRDPVVWAAINVVLALGSQHMPKGSDHPCGSSRSASHYTSRYLNQAQSVVSAVMLGQTRLLNIQVLIGMVMVLQTEHDPTASLILISATMRLAHKMGLHNRAASAHLDRVERIQHARVFWLAYILDKDLSLRAGQPSLQLDDDIDVELPSVITPEGEEGEDTPGVVVTTNRDAKMNYFIMRIQLANIEGGVYDFIYSTRSLKRRPEERAVAMESIVSAIERWRDSIPPEFGAAVVTSNTRDDPAKIGFFTTLHATSLACTTLVHRAHAWDQQWVTSLRDHGRGAKPLTLPPRWQPLVQQAREYAVLFSETWSSDVWYRWMASCPYSSSMVLLTANNLSDPQHENIQQDIELVDAALLWLNEDMRDIQSEETQVLRTVCDEAAREVRQKHAEAIAASHGGGRFLNFLDMYGNRS